MYYRKLSTVQSRNDQAIHTRTPQKFCSEKVLQLKQEQNNRTAHKAMEAPNNEANEKFRGVFQKGSWPQKCLVPGGCPSRVLQPVVPSLRLPYLTLQILSEKAKHTRSASTCCAQAQSSSSPLISEAYIQAQVVSIVLDRICCPFANFTIVKRSI